MLTDCLLICIVVGTVLSGPVYVEELEDLVPEGPDRFELKMLDSDKLMIRSQKQQRLYQILARQPTYIQAPFTSRVQLGSEDLECSETKAGTTQHELSCSLFVNDSVSSGMLSLILICVVIGSVLPGPVYVDELEDLVRERSPDYYELKSLEDDKYMIR
ncbi:unnamed protein product [Strongylus vulgaris]|uniref:Uncharacterized protein n=1 Tax=Strongylus vulgaris TaxID=40348 RepID=A0A3P7IXH8_STRVU|nr:unnamed protein product [Strongylus vulgaris]